MKLSEAIKEVENDRKKVFQSIPINPYDDVLRLSIRDNKYLEIINLRTDKSQSIINIDRKWEEIRQSVTWQEAFEAWVNGNDIYCVSKDKATEHTYQNGARFVDENGEAVSYWEIKKSTWYIK